MAFSIISRNLAARKMYIMSKCPLISVIIPVFNTAQYLKESITSITNQTIHEIEIIVVDDCSTDNSEIVIKELELADKRIQYIKLAKNQGQSVARNEALKYASGKYLYFMDSDDVLEKDALEKCYSQCEQRKLELIFFDGNIFCDEGVPALSWDYHRTGRYDEDTVYVGKELFKDMLAHCTHRAAPWLMFVSRSHLENLNLRYYPGIIHEDELFTTLLYLQSSRIGCLKQSLIRHRVRSNSTMTTRYSIRNVRCYLTVVDELFAFARNHKCVELVSAYARYTLNPVYETAKVLSYEEKVEALSLCVKKGYLRYLSVKTLLKFLFK